MIYQILKFSSILAVLLASYVAGHGRMTTPTTRDTLNGASESTQNAPIGYNTNFGCRGYAAGTTVLTASANTNITTSWTFSALHPGDCFFYLSYDVTKSQDQQAWFKIAEIAYCNTLSGTNYPVTIPYWVPTGQAILRFEWYALHLVTTIEFYSQCADIYINGNANGVIGTPLAYVPYHLPADNSNYTNYRLAYDTTAPFFFTGPALATPSSFVAAPTSGISSSSSGSSSSSTGSISKGGEVALGIFGVICGVGVAAGAIFMYRRVKNRASGNLLSNAYDYRNSVADQSTVDRQSAPVYLGRQSAPVTRQSGASGAGAPKRAGPVPNFVVSAENQQ